MPDWDEVEACLRKEAEILRRSAASDVPDGIEEVMDVIREHDDVEYAEIMQVFSGHDPGTAGLILALSAAPTAAFYSCRGSSDAGHHADHPRIGLVPDANRAQLIVRLAETADCGIKQYGAGWYLCARSVRDFHRLAHLVLQHRADFDAMPPPSWVDGWDDELAKMREE
ncbi:hypothetical protein [Streptomyces sp. gb1(2016)]|uniref:hypothetical protein n=1 Tax=Streptomyces sp. gb1(2016) TaxID=1828321 RepID=UPI00164EF682|nr:hypothetical protein [Streptomyces sp. gb1(2016)]